MCGMTTISLTVNGRPETAAVEPRTHLADFLREHCRLTGTHLGCEHGVCGACTVEADGAIIRACITFAVACDGAEVNTIEAFDDDELMGRLRAAFTREHGLQCGFCTPGMLVTARDIIQRLGAIEESRLRVELSGNLCRCTGYAGIVNAVGAVMKELPTDFTVGTRSAAAPAVAVASSPALASPVLSVQAATIPRGLSAAGAGPAIIDSFRLPQPPDRVWAALQDLPRVAACLPGVELVDYAGGDHVQGRLVVKMGPIHAAFAGEADVTREPAAQRAVISGAGRDQKSGSRATGTLTYVVVGEPDGSRVDVTLAFVLTGTLAQFSRSSLVKAFASRLIADFADNLRRLLESGEAAPATQAQLNLGGVAWAVLRDRIRAAIAFLNKAR
jgi:carbon-monoxide dehydrogenase small subunit